MFVSTVSYSIQLTIRSMAVNTVYIDIQRARESEMDLDRINATVTRYPNSLHYAGAFHRNAPA